MKNGLLIWNIALTLIAGYLLFDHFSNRKKETAATKDVSKDPPAANNGFRIAYFDMDSVENNFLMVKDVRAEVNQREREYNNDLAQLDMTFQKEVEGYREKAKTAPMSQDEYEKAQVALRKLDDQLKQQKQGLDQAYQDFRMRHQLALMNEIKDYLQEYNKTKKYSYIMVYQQDLYYYRDTAYNITDELIQGLNERYRKKQK
jgi:outer membrane protein